MLKPCAHLLCTFTLSLILCAQAQADIHVETTTINSTDGLAQYQLPTLRGDTPAQQAIAQHINLFLQLAISDNVGTEPEQLPVNFETLDTQYITSVTYRVAHQTEKYLSLQIIIQTPEDRRVHNHTFDLNTAQPITADMLFTQEGNIWINDTIEKQRTAAYENLITAVEGQYEHNLPPQAQQTIETLKDCLDWEVGEIAATTSFTFFDGVLLLLPGHTLAIEDNTACSETLASLDGLPTLNAWHNTFTHAQLQAHLSPYGRCILSSEADTCTPLYPYTAAPGIWNIPLPNSQQLTLVAVHYSPYYMDDMGDDLYTGLIYNQQPNIHWNSVHNDRHLLRDLPLENTTDNAPLFIGNFQYITPDQSEHTIRLAFYRDGQWKPYP